MCPRRSILAGLLLALPSVAVLAQDNPWRVPSAPGGYVPPYAVQDYGSASRYGASSPRPQNWSEEAPYGQARASSGQQDFEGFDRDRWRGGEGGFTASGQPILRAGPPRQAALVPQGRYDTGPVASPSQGFGQTWKSGQIWGSGQTWNGGPGYLPPAIATGSLPDGRSVRDGGLQFAPITQYPPTGGYGEYPPLDEAAAAQNRREAPAQRPAANNGLDTRGTPSVGPQLLYGPSILTSPYSGLPGPGGYGYGGLPGPYGYPGVAYPPGW